MYLGAHEVLRGPLLSNGSMGFAKTQAAQKVKQAAQGTKGPFGQAPGRSRIGRSRVSRPRGGV